MVEDILWPPASEEAAPNNDETKALPNPPHRLSQASSDYLPSRSIAFPPLHSEPDRFPEPALLLFHIAASMLFKVLHSIPMVFFFFPTPVSVALCLCFDCFASDEERRKGDSNCRQGLLGASAHNRGAVRRNEGAMRRRSNTSFSLHLFGRLLPLVSFSGL